MASPGAGDPSRLPHVPIEIDSDSQSSTSDSASRGRDSDGHPGTVCAWRTARYHEQECARYFDCPSHVVERALSDSEQESEGEPEEDHQGQEDVEPEEDVQDRPDPDAVSPLSEEGDEIDGGPRARWPSPEVPVATSGVTNVAQEARGPPGQARLQQEERGSGSNNAVDDGLFGVRREMNPEAPAERLSNEDGGSGVPTSAAPSGSMRRDHGPIPEPAAGSASSGSSVSPTVLPSRAAQVLSTEHGLATPSEVVLPRWQPDSEATYCFICGTQFSFFVRKHHCRRCGRVVCNSCSPHRITIPYQYIVRPPGTPSPAPPEPSPSLPGGRQGWYPEFGGERVRLCNPCVPDPNIAPPQSQGHQTRPEHGVRPPVQAPNAPVSNRWSYHTGLGAANDAQTRSRSVTMQPGPSSSNQPLFPPRGTTQDRILWGTPPPYLRSPSTSQTSHLYPGLVPRYRPMLDVGDRSSPSSTAAGPSAPTSTTHRRVNPRHQIPEEDECPVCHRELPPRTLPNFESLREAHIHGCITSHSRYGRGGITSGDDGDDDPDMLPPMPPRRTGMFPYTATEKDCVDSAECSICLEEFEAGVAMARLECLCRFHRACINAWWERHPGRCPMHQHDGFGY